jgi:hypothetical protein
VRDRDGNVRDRDRNVRDRDRRVESWYRTMGLQPYAFDL